MRIVGGEFRGRSLATPKSNDIRPTADRTRESLFNILSHAYPEAIDGTRMMDVFAGTGAVGLEAASRGCRHVLFVESSVEARGFSGRISTPSGCMGARACCDGTQRISAASAISSLSIFSLPIHLMAKGSAKAFAAAAAGGWLVPGALAILEERADVTVSAPSDFLFLEVRTFGDSKMHFFRYQPRSA